MIARPLITFFFCIVFQWHIVSLSTVFSKQSTVKSEMSSVFGGWKYV